MKDPHLDLTQNEKWVFERNYGDQAGVILKQRRSVGTSDVIFDGKIQKNTEVKK